jgi:hypothetical protein
MSQVGSGHMYKLRSAYNNGYRRLEKMSYISTRGSLTTLIA